VVEVVGVAEEEWALAKERFLCLSPEEPRSSYSTPAGALLLSRERAGKLFVKGAYVTTVDDMVAGLDLVEARLDRDRAATLRREDLEHVASAAWCGALRTCDGDRTEDLAARYFELLRRDDAETLVDLRHAGFYVEEREANLIADLWVAANGPDAFPVSSADGAARTTVRKAFDLGIVGYVPVDAGKALADVLRAATTRRSSSRRRRQAGDDALLPQSSSGELLIVPLRDAVDAATAALEKHKAASLDTRKSESVVVCLADLVPSERAVVRDAADLLGDAVPLFELLDVLDDNDTNNDQEAAIVWPAEERRLRVSRTSLSHDDDDNTNVARLASDALDAFLEKKTSSNEARRTRRRVVAKLLPPAAPTTTTTTTCFCGGADPRICSRREQALRDDIDALRQHKARLEADNDSLRSRLADESARVDQLKIERMNAEHRMAIDAERRVAAKHQSELDDLRRQLEAARARALESDRDTRAFKQRADDAQARVSVHIACAQRRAELAVDRSAALREALHGLRDRLRRPASLKKPEEEDLARNNDEQPADEASAELERITDTYLPDIAKSLHIASPNTTDFSSSSRGRLCAICMTNPVDVLLLPCRHLAFCADCSQHLTRCPYCRQAVDSRMQVYT